MQLIVNGFSSEKKTIAGFGCSQGPARKASLSRTKALFPSQIPTPLARIPGSYPRRGPLHMPLLPAKRRQPFVPKRKSVTESATQKRSYLFHAGHTPAGRISQTMFGPILNLEQNHTSQASCCGPSPLFSAAPHPEIRPPSCRCRPDSGGMYPCSRTQWY